jgi:O-antigen/teichoic acid export membrane protein
VEGLHHEVFGKRVVLHGRFVPDLLYRMSLQPAPIRDDAGRPLEDPGEVSAFFYLGWRQPYVRWEQGTAILEAQGPRMLIGYLFGTAALGAFSFGLRMVDTLYQLLTLPAANVMVPVVARIRDEPKRFERAVLSATMLVATITVPIFVGLSLIAPVAVPLLFGQHWAESAVILQIIGFVGISNSIAQINRSVLAGLGRPDINLAMNVTAAIANVGLVLLTAPWGLTATAIAFVARGYVVMPIVLVVMTRLTGIGVAAQARVYCPVAVAAAVMALCVEGLLRGLGPGLSPAALTAAAVACGAASYVLALCLFGRPALKLGASILADLRPRQKPA